MAPSPPDVFTSSQRQALQGVIDGLLPPLLVPPRDDDPTTQTREHQTYYESRLASDDVFLHALLDSFQQELSVADRLSIQSLLTLLSSSFGTSLLLTRPTRAFTELSVPQQSLALSQLQHASRSLQLPHWHRLLQHWILRTAYTYLGTAVTRKTQSRPGRHTAPRNLTITNPHYAAMGYVPTRQDPTRSSTRASLTTPYTSLVYNEEVRSQMEVPVASDPSSSSTDTERPHLLHMECDILMVGSGPASAVAANVLGKAGYKVLVVEQGAHTKEPGSSEQEQEQDASHFQTLWTDEGSALKAHYHGAARYGGTKQCAPILLAGRTLGGGSTIGYGACWPMTETVWKEWLQAIYVGSSDYYPSGGALSSSTTSNNESMRRLDDQKQRLSEEYMAAMDFVTHKLGLPTLSSQWRRNQSSAPFPASPHPLSLPHNAANLKLLQSCDRMGYPWQALPQAYGDKMDPNNGYYASLAGDRYGNKRTSHVFFQEACQFGVRLLEDCRIDRIITETSKSSSVRPRAIGADGTMCGNVAVRIVARRAILVGAGALHTPCLLQQSKLRNRHIGKHLKVNPTTTVFGFMKEPVDAYLGLPQTVVCTEFERGWKQNGHGAKIHCQNMHPGFLSMSLAWTTPYEFKERMRRFRNIVPLAVQQRDLGEGSVRVGIDGHTPVVRYSLSTVDRLSMLHAMQGGVKLLATAGATEIVTGHKRDTGFVRGDAPHDMIHLATDQRLHRYVSSLPRLGMKPYDIPLFSTHQSGTCRMSSSPVDGVVDFNGECWEVDNLFVIDSSIFPSSPGVNPMLTVMIFAKLLSSRLSTRLRYEDQQPMSVTETAKAKAMMDTRIELRSSFHPKAGRMPSLLDLLPHILLWVTVFLVFLPLILSAATPEIEIPTEMPPSLVDEFLKRPFKSVKTAWREAADFLTFW